MLITWKRLGYSLFCVPLLACPAADEDDATTGNDTSSGDSNSTTNTNTSSSSMSSTSSTTASTTDSTTTVDPDTGTSTMTMTTTLTTTTAEDSTSTTAGGELCEIMLPPGPECPFPAPSRPGLAPRRAPSGGADIDDLAPQPDELGGGSFIMQPDAGDGFECDIWEQNCPDGDKCMPWANDGGGAWNATRCSPIDANPNAVGDPCTVEGSGVSGIDDCDLGAMCWDVDPETNMGACVELCSCAEDFPVCNTPNSACSISNQGVLVLCLPVCNPLDPAACPEGQGCYGVSDTFQCAPDVSGAMGAVGDECGFVNVCDPGNFCASAASVPGCNGGAPGCCSSFCSIGNDAECLDGQECVPWFAEGQAPDECLGTVGACVSQ